MAADHPDCFDRHTCSLFWRTGKPQGICAISQAAVCTSHRTCGSSYVGIVVFLTPMKEAFTTKHESNVTGIRRSVAKRLRRLWIGVSQARLPVVSTLP
ncbi:MAG: hypothetical protein JRC69_03190 [Deltaproteobacteria bacterium]|nr:hypothetical protein [Deltaproteobacteria bacterium]